MDKNIMMNNAKIAYEDLEKAAGGHYPVIGFPGIIDFPIDIPKHKPKDEPRDGGATGSW